MRFLSRNMTAWANGPALSEVERVAHPTLSFTFTLFYRQFIDCGKDTKCHILGSVRIHGFASLRKNSKKRYICSFDSAVGA